MAITIQQQPTASGFYPVGNPIEYLVSSSLSTAPNFKIEVKVYSPDSAVSPLATMRYDIIPSTTQILADVTKILQSTITENITNLRTSAVGVKNETTKWHTAKVTFGESYGAIPSVTGSPTSSNIVTFWNGALKYQGWNTTTLGKYTIPSGGGQVLTRLFLTPFTNSAAVSHSTVVASPSTYFKGSYNVRKITSAQLIQLSWLWSGTGGTQSSPNIEAFKTNFSSSILGGSALASVQSQQSMNIGTSALIALGAPLSGLNSTYTWLLVSLWNNSNQQTQSYLYEIDWSPCSRFDSYEIHWLNRLGGWDSWIFNKRSRHSTEIERQGYNPTFLPISGSTISRNSYDITGRNYVVSTKENYILNSNYLKAWELEGLEDLITSPSVYWNSSDGFINIAIKEPNIFEHKTNTVDKLFNLSFSFEIDNQDIRQLP